MVKYWIGLLITPKYACQWCQIIIQTQQKNPSSSSSLQSSSRTTRSRRLYIWDICLFSAGSTDCVLRDMKEEPTCTEIILLHSKGLYAKVEGVDGEQACDGVVLLLVAHVGAAHTRLPQAQAAVGLRKRHTWRKHTCILNKEMTFACFWVCVCVWCLKYVGRWDSSDYQSSSFLWHSGHAGGISLCPVGREKNPIRNIEYASKALVLNKCTFS